MRKAWMLQGVLSGLGVGMPLGYVIPSPWMFILALVIICVAVYRIEWLP